MTNSEESFDLLIRQWLGPKCRKEGFRYQFLLECLRQGRDGWLYVPLNQILDKLDAKIRSMHVGGVSKLESHLDTHEASKPHNQIRPVLRKFPRTEDSDFPKGKECAEDNNPVEWVFFCWEEPEINDIHKIQSAISFIKVRTVTRTEKRARRGRPTRERTEKTHRNLPILELYIAAYLCKTDAFIKDDKRIAKRLIGLCNAQTKRSSLVDGLAYLKPEALIKLPPCLRGASPTFAVALIEMHLKEINPGRIDYDQLPAPPSLVLQNVSRRDVLSKLTDLVLNEYNQPKNRRIILHGMPGSGKTTLLLELLQVKIVRDHFRETLAWIPLTKDGQDVLASQRQLLLALSDSANLESNSIAVNRGLITNLLKTRRILILLDNAWTKEQIEAFGEPGPHSRILVTTRQPKLARELGTSSEIAMPPPSEEFAYHILEKWSGTPEGELPLEGRQLAQECGYLPLALALAGSMVATGTPWDILLERVASADIEALQGELPDYEHKGLLKALQVSIDDLPREPVDVHKCLLDIAIFPEGVKIPRHVLRLLWEESGLCTSEVYNVLSALTGRSFLVCDSSQEYTVHDVYRDYAQVILRDNLRLRHEVLLSAYARLCPCTADSPDQSPSPDWACGPSDDYLFKNLIFHLVRARRVVDASRLLEDYRWLYAKLCHCSVAQIVADYGLLPLNRTRASICSAFQFSAAFISRTSEQLAGHLTGRLLWYNARNTRHFLATVRNYAMSPWIRPLTPIGAHPIETVWRLIPDQPDDKHHVAITTDGQVAIIAHIHLVRIWDISMVRVSCEFDVYPAIVTALALHDDRFIIVGLDCDLLLLWDLCAKSVCAVFNGSYPSIPVSACRRNHGPLLACGDEQGKILIWHSRENRGLRNPEGDSWLNPGVPNFFEDLDLGYPEDCDDSRGSSRVPVYESTIELQAHSGPVHNILVTRDGTKLVSASTDGVLGIWDAMTGQMLRRISVRSGRITALAIIPDSGSILSASHDGTLQLWDVENGQEQSVAKQLSCGIVSIGILPQSNYVAAADDRNTISILDIPGFNFKYAIDTPQRHGAPVMFAGAVGQAISAAQQYTIVWDLQAVKATPKSGLRYNTNSIRVAQEMHGLLNAPASDAFYAIGNGLQLWEFRQRRCKHSVAIPETRWKELAVTDGGQSLVAIGHERITVFDALELTERFTLINCAIDLKATVCEDKYIVAIHREQKYGPSILSRWRSKDGCLISEWKSNLPYKSVHGFPHCSAVLLRRYSGEMEYWDCESVSGREVYRNPEGDHVSACHMIGNTGSVCIVMENGSIYKIHVLGRGRTACIGENVAGWNCTDEMSQIMTDGRLVIAEAGRQIAVWSLDEEKRCFYLARHDCQITRCRASRDGKQVISTSLDGTLCVSSVYEKRVIASFSCEDRLWDCVSSENGSEIAVLDSESRLSFFRLEVGTSP